MGLDLFKINNQEQEYPDEFEKHVLNWNWPSTLQQSQPEQLQNVTAVLWKMRESNRTITEDLFKQARDKRASEVREYREQLCEEYHKTVHKNCVTNLGFRKDNGYRHPMDAFVKEAKKVIVNY